MSLRSLYASGSSFESVRIFVTTRSSPGWNFKDSRIKVEPVPDIGDGFWMLNKSYVCESNYETVVFLDVDTVVVNSIDEVVKGRTSDLIARCAPRVKSGHFSESGWEERLSKYECGGYPYLSSGFMIFQGGSQKEIKDRWIELTKDILEGRRQEDPSWHANQDAFSIACCVEDLSVSLMKDHEHAYAMIGEDPEKSIVYHLGTPNFYYYYFKASKYIKEIDEEMPVKKPSLLRMHRLKNRLVRKIRKKLGMSRESKPKWSRS